MEVIMTVQQIFCEFEFLGQLNEKLYIITFIEIYLNMLRVTFSLFVII